jgi:hypothetical protein
LGISIAPVPLLIENIFDEVRNKSSAMFVLPELMPGFVAKIFLVHHEL